MRFLTLLTLGALLAPPLVAQTPDQALRNRPRAEAQARHAARLARAERMVARQRQMVRRHERFLARQQARIRQERMALRGLRLHQPRRWRRAI